VIPDIESDTERPQKLSHPAYNTKRRNNREVEPSNGSAPRPLTWTTP
jgi:hypothetical protein